MQRRATMLEPVRETGPAARRRCRREAKAAPASEAAALSSAASAAAAAAGFSMGVAPAQGLLDTPPHAPLPASWRRLSCALAGRVHPERLFHEYLSARLLAGGPCASTGAGGSALPGPRIRVLRPTASQAQIDMRRRVAGVRLLRLRLLWLGVHVQRRTSCTGSLSVLQANPRALPRVGGAGCALARAPDPRLLPREHGRGGRPLPLRRRAPGTPGLAVAIFNAASLALVGALEGVDSRRSERTMMSLRLSFDTRLGMYSPR